MRIKTNDLIKVIKAMNLRSLGYFFDFFSLVCIFCVENDKVVKFVRLCYQHTKFYGNKYSACTRAGFIWYQHGSMKK